VPVTLCSALVPSRNHVSSLAQNQGRKMLAILSSVTATCQQFGINLWAYLRDTLTKLPTTPADQLHTLLPPRQLKTLSNLLFGTGPFLADFLYGFPEFPALNRAAFVSFLNLRHKKFSDIFVFLYLDESKPCYLRKNLTLKQAN